MQIDSGLSFISIIVGLIVSLVSVFIGIYYVIKAIFLSKDSKNYKKVQHFFIVAGIYILCLPLMIISFTHGIMGPLLLLNLQQAPTNGISIATSKMILERSPFEMYAFILGFAGIVFGIKKIIHFYLEKKKL